MDDDLKNNILAGDEKINELAQKIRVAGEKSFQKNNPFADSGKPEPINFSSEKKEISDKAIEQISSEPALNPIRTYGDDIAHTIKDQKESVLSINLAEKKKAEASQNLAEEQKKDIYAAEEGKRGRLITIISIILVVAGIGTITTFYFLSKRNNVVVKPNAPIVADNHIVVTLQGLSRDQIINEISSKKEQAIKNDNIYYLDLSSQNEALNLNPFLSAVSPNIPQYLLRSFGNKLDLGVYSEENKELFLLVSVNSMDNAFAGMLEWEKAIPDEVLPLFSQSANSTNDPLKNKNFQDVVINNKDARVLRDNDRNPVITYSFLDSKTLVITQSDSTLRELINRYNASKLER
jgi:hypothetical protein